MADWSTFREDQLVFEADLPKISFFTFGSVMITRNRLLSDNQENSHPPLYFYPQSIWHQRVGQIEQAAVDKKKSCSRSRLKRSIFCGHLIYFSRSFNFAVGAKNRFSRTIFFCVSDLSKVLCIYHHL